MNSLNRFRPAKQFRCLPLVGKNSPFGYVEIVRGEDGSHNYQSCAGVVGVFSEMNQKGREEWKSLIGITGTKGESSSTSQDMTANGGKSSSRAQVIRMNACSLLSGSGKGSRG